MLLSLPVSADSLLTTPSPGLVLRAVLFPHMGSVHVQFLMFGRPFCLLFSCLTIIRSLKISFNILPEGRLLWTPSLEQMILCVIWCPRIMFLLFKSLNLSIIINLSVWLFILLIHLSPVLYFVSHESRRHGSFLLPFYP